MVPGRDDNDPGSGPYEIKRKKLYNFEETEQIDETKKKPEWVKRVMKIKIRSPEKKLTGKPVKKKSGNILSKNPHTSNKWSF
jgi:hypothetical protein